MVNILRICNVFKCYILGLFAEVLKLGVLFLRLLGVKSWPVIGQGLWPGLLP